MSYFSEILARLGYRNQKSADGRLRISSQLSLGDYKQYLNNAGGQYNTELIGNGAATYEGDAIGGTTFTTEAINDVVIRQSYQWHNYFAGKPQKIELTASKFDKQSGITKRIGYFSSNTATPFNSDLDGLFFESNENGIYCKIYREGTEVFSLESANWLNQKEITNFEPANFNFYVIDFLYLGGAIANFWILTESGLTLIASYQHINEDQNTFIKSPNQPVRFEMRQTAAGTGLFNQICADVATEGQDSLVGISSSYNTDGNALSGLSTNTRYAVLGVRQSATSRNISLRFQNISVLSITNDDLLVEVFFGGSTSGSPTWSGSSFSNTEHFTAATDISGNNNNRVHSGGVLIASSYVAGNLSQSNKVETLRRLGSYIDGTTEEFYLCVTPLSANAGAYASVDWIEFI